jgi:hypothetical protein
MRYKDAKETVVYMLNINKPLFVTKEIYLFNSYYCQNKKNGEQNQARVCLRNWDKSEQNKRR